MRRTGTLAVVVLAVVLAGTVHAQNVNWTYAEAGFGTFDPDRGSRENGWFVDGMFGLGKIPIHVFGEYGDYGPLNVWQAGAGWHGALGKQADLFADAALYDLDYDDGLKVRFGARWMLSERLELNGYLAFADLDIRDNRSLAVNAVVGLAKRFAVGGGFEWGDEIFTAQGLARFNFGPTK